MSGQGLARSIGPHFLIPARPKFSCHAEHSPLIFVLVPCRASFKWAGLVPCWAGPSRLTPLRSVPYLASGDGDGDGEKLSWQGTRSVFSLHILAQCDCDQG
ncbi:unnamed protein product [Prunus armeniaca]